MGKNEMKVEELVLVPQKSFRSNATDPATVAEYAGLMSQGVTFPPLTIASVGKNKKRVLVGGAHRLAAAVKAKLETMPVAIVTCKAAIDAEVLAFTDNVSHGLSLTVEEKRLAIIELLQTPSFKKLSNLAAAKRLGVSDMSIKRYRDAIGTKSPKASQSGHKVKGTVKPSTKTQVSQGGVVTKTESDPVAWKINGAMLGGGHGRVASAITSKVFEGASPKSPKSYMERVQFMEGVVVELQATIDAAKAELAKA